MEFKTYLNLCDKNFLFKSIKTRRKQRLFFYRHNIFTKNNFDLNHFGFIKFYTFFFRTVYKHMIFLFKFSYLLNVYKNSFNLNYINIFLFSNFINLTKKTFLLKYSTFFFKQTFSEKTDFYLNFLSKRANLLKDYSFTNYSNNYSLTPILSLFNDVDANLDKNKENYIIRTISVSQNYNLPSLTATSDYINSASIQIRALALNNRNVNNRLIFLFFMYTVLN